MPRTKVDKPGRRENGAGNWTRLKGPDGKPTGKIQVEFRLTNGETGKVKAITRTADGDLEAGTIAAELKAELDRKYPGGVWYPDTKPGGSKPGTVNALLDEWSAAYLPTVGHTTADNYTYLSRYIRTHPLGEKRVQDVTLQEVNRFLASLRTRNKSEPVPLSASTKNAVRKVLGMAFAYAIAHDETVKVNPVSDASIPRSDITTPNFETDPDQRWFDEDEVGRFFEAVQVVEAEAKENTDGRSSALWLSAAWALQYRLGLRPGEVRALAWDDVDLSATPPTIHVRHGQQRISGRLLRGNTKNQKSRRLLALPDDVVTWLESHRALQQSQRDLYAPDAKWNSENLIFTRADGTPVSSESYGRAFAKVIDRAELTNATPYALRHTCCTLLVLAGVPLPDVAKLMGHSDLSMVTRVYAHHRHGLVDIPADAMPALPGALATV